MLYIFVVILYSFKVIQSYLNIVNKDNFWFMPFFTDPGATSERNLKQNSQRINLNRPN